MQHITLQQLVDLLEVMTITQTIDNGFAITQHGHIKGAPTIAISTCAGTEDCYIVQ